MSLRGKFARGSLLLLGGNMMGQACAFVRGLIVFNLLGSEQMGLAAVFSMTIAFIDSISALGTDKILVQAEDGDAELFQGVAHTTQLLRGLVIGVVIALVAEPAASLFGQPETAWAFYLVALVPIIRSCQHLDCKRMHRSMSFKADVAAETGTQLVLVAAAYPLAALIGDYRAVVVLLLGSGIVYTLMTHVVAKRRYRLLWDLGIARRMLGFGWPLLINGMLVFAIMQGEVFLIAIMPQLTGAEYSEADRGIYLAATRLAVPPMRFLTTIAGKLVLPLLSRAQDDAPAFSRRYRLCVEGLTFAGIMLALLFVVGGPMLVDVLYKSDYAAAATLLVLLGAAQALRAVRAAPTLAAMSRGDTKLLMHANIVRVCGLLVAAYFAFEGRPMAWIAAAGLGAEIAACVFCAFVLKKHGLPLGETLRPLIVLLALGTAGAFAASELGVWTWSPLAAAVGTAGAMLLAIPVMLVFLPTARGELVRGGAMLRTRLASRGADGRSLSAPGAGEDR